MMGKWKFNLFLHCPLYRLTTTFPHSRHHFKVDALKMCLYPPFQLQVFLLSLHIVPHHARIAHLAENDNVNNSFAGKGLTCPEEEAGHRKISGIILLILAGLGFLTNLMVMIIILTKKRVRRWSLGLIFHQCLVDCFRACILIPLGRSLLECQPVLKCSLLETAFLLFATVSTVSIGILTIHNFGTSNRRSSRSAFERLTGNDVSGH